jgi:hypothetical protein
MSDFPCYMQLTKFIGRSGNRRSVTAQHEGATNHDLVGWNCFLKIPWSFLCSLLSLHSVPGADSGSTLPNLSGSLHIPSATTVPSFHGQVNGYSRCTISTVDVWWNASCSYLLAFSAQRTPPCALLAISLSISIPAFTAVSYVFTFYTEFLRGTGGIQGITGGYSGPRQSSLKANKLPSNVQLSHDALT